MPEELLTIRESELMQKAREGYEFTFDRPLSLVARWGAVVHALHSYMGYKLFLANGAVKMAMYVKGMRSPEGEITLLTVRRD